MTGITLNHAVLVIFFLIILLTIAHARAEYWRGRCEQMEKNDQHEFLVEENRFWRYRENTEAADAAVNSWDTGDNGDSSPYITFGR